MSANAVNRILLVEDDAKLAGILRRGLELDGISTDLAETAEQALAMAARADYDAFVVDVMLPGMDGLEVCRRLRRGGLRTPVVVISARDDLTDRDLRDAGADQFMAKPFAIAALEARLRRAPTQTGWVAPHLPAESAPVQVARGTVTRRRWWRRPRCPR